MGKKVILHILNSNKYSGAENVVITIIDYMQENYNEYRFIYMSPKGPIENILKLKKIEYIGVDEISINTIRKAIAKFSPALIHAHDFRAGLMTAWTFTSVPIINHLHNNPLWMKKVSLNSIVYLTGMLRFKKILLVSNAVKEEYVFGKYMNKKSEVIGNPFDADKIRFLANNTEIVEDYDVVFLGRLVEQKNPVFFINVIKELVKEIPGLKVAMIGAGELEEKICKMINENKLQKNIRLYGFLDNPYCVLKKAKVMCMPSKWEGFGLAALEALTLGVPVVCSGVGGLKDFVNESCGALCGNEKNKYVEEIVKLLIDKKYREQKVLQAIKVADKMSNIESYIGKIIDLYKSYSLYKMK